MNQRNKALFTRTHRTLFAVAWLLLLASFAAALYGIHTLPDTIATHFTLDGTPDEYGSPTTLLILPAIMTVCLGAISLVAYMVPPEQWNIPFSVPEQCRTAVWRDMLSMLAALELEIGAFTLFATLQSLSQRSVGSMIACCVLLAAITLTIVLALRRAKRHSRTHEN